PARRAGTSGKMMYCLKPYYLLPWGAVALASAWEASRAAMRLALEGPWCGFGLLAPPLAAEAYFGCVVHQGARCPAGIPFATATPRTSEGRKRMSIKRRTVLKGLAATGAMAVYAPAVLRAQGAPFKIGLLTVKTGPLAQGGIQMEQGIATFLKEKNNTLSGRKIEFISADTGGNPAGAKTKAQELIERDKVNVILGPLAAFELLAITDYIRAQEQPLISLAAAENVTQRNVNPWIVRPSATSGQCAHAMADYA